MKNIQLLQVQKNELEKKVNQKTKYSKFNHFFSKNFSTFTAPALPITMESSCNEKKIKACKYDTECFIKIRCYEIEGAPIFSSKYYFIQKMLFVLHRL